MSGDRHCASGVAAAALIAALIAALTCGAFAPRRAQAVQDSMMSAEERARTLEKEIGALEARLVSSQQDSVSIARRLLEVERRILECYMEIDAVEAAVRTARRVLNGRFRALYVAGRSDPLVRLLESENVTDFLVWSERMLNVAASESKAFEGLRSKKSRLREVQARLQEYKNEQAVLNETADTAAIQADLELRKNELAEVNASLIAMQLPGTYTPAPRVYDPGRIFSEPDEKGFVRTGQIFSGYAGWYGGESQGKATASGEVFDQYAFTCAHRTLPFGTYLRVSFLGRSVIVKVNDRGPSPGNRTVDISRGAAEAVGLRGVRWVDCEIIVPRS